MVFSAYQTRDNIAGRPLARKSQGAFLFSVTFLKALVERLGVIARPYFACRR